MHISGLPEIGFLRLSEVLKIVPVKKATWYMGIKAGRYPEPVKIGPRASAWRVEDIKNLVYELGTGHKRKIEAELLEMSLTLMQAYSFLEKSKNTRRSPLHTGQISLSLKRKEVVGPAPY